MNTNKEFMVENLSQICKGFDTFLSEEQREAKYRDEENNAPISQYTEIGRINFYRTCEGSAFLPKDAVYRSYADLCKMIRYIKKLPAQAPIDKVVTQLRKFLSDKHKYYSIMLIDETYNVSTQEYTSSDQSEIVALMEPESIIVMVSSELSTVRKKIYEGNGTYRTIFVTEGHIHHYRKLTRDQYLEEHGSQVYESMHFFDSSTPIQFRQNQEFMESLYDSNFDFEVPKMKRECTISDYVRMHEDGPIDFITKDRIPWSAIASAAMVAKTQWTKQEYIERSKLLKAYLDFIKEHPECADLFDDIDTGICPYCHKKTRIKINVPCRHCGTEIGAEDLATMELDACQGVSFDAPMVDWLMHSDSAIQRIINLN